MNFNPPRPFERVEEREVRSTIGALSETELRAWTSDGWTLVRRTSRGCREYTYKFTRTVRDQS